MSLGRDPGQRILPQREREPLTIIILIGRILPLHRNPTHGSPKWSPPKTKFPRNWNWRVKRSEIDTNRNKNVEIYFPKWDETSNYAFSRHHDLWFLHFFLLLWFPSFCECSLSYLMVKVTAKMKCNKCLFSSLCLVFTACVRWVALTRRCVRTHTFRIGWKWKVKSKLRKERTQIGSKQM